MEDKFIKGATFSLCVILLQGFNEVTLFTAGIDFLFWSMAGLIFARARYIDKITNNDTRK